MVSEDELVSQFSDLGMAVTDQKILDKCVDLCIAHRMSEEDLVNAWMAFSITNLDGADPTLETLVQMERKELAKNENQMKTPCRSSKFTNSAKKPAKVLVYDPADQLDSTLDSNVDDLMDTYQNQSYQTPKAKTKTAQRNDAAGAFSPIGYSPKVATPSQRYDSRGNAGEVLLSLGNVAEATWSADSVGRRKATVTPHSSWPADWRYMLDCNLLLDEVAIHDDQLEYLAGQICFNAGLRAAELESNALPFQEAVYTYGRVCNGEAGAMTSKSVLLEAGLRFDGAAVPMSLGRLAAYSLFPGQTVVVRGANPTGRLILAEEVFASAPLPMPARLPTRFPTFTADAGVLQVVVAAGPFTTQDTLNFRPLEDLTAYVAKHRPQVLVLVGPFVDVQHPLVKEGLLAEPVAEFFEKRFVKLADTALEAKTHLVLVSSWREASHHAVYPTPAYRLPRWPASVLRLPDPATFDVDGVVFAVSATDVLKHLASQELSFFSESHRKTHGYGNRVHRLAEHLLAQQTFYPLYPPAEELNVDAEMLRDHAHMAETPHVLVLPSDMRFFATEVKGCVIVNPERLAKGLIGGTFARFEISPPAPDTTPRDFHRHIAVNIVQI